MIIRLEQSEEAVPIFNFEVKLGSSGLSTILAAAGRNWTEGLQETMVGTL